MTTTPTPRVGTFRHEARCCGLAVSGCVIQSVSGAPHHLDITVGQARALSLALSRAILEYELIATDGADSQRPGGVS